MPYEYLRHAEALEERLVEQTKALKQATAVVSDVEQWRARFMRAVKIGLVVLGLVLAGLVICLVILFGFEGHLSATDRHTREAILQTCQAAAQLRRSARHLWTQVIDTVFPSGSSHRALVVKHELLRDVDRTYRVLSCKRIIHHAAKP